MCGRAAKGGYYFTVIYTALLYSAAGPGLLGSYAYVTDQEQKFSAVWYISAWLIALVVSATYVWRSFRREINLSKQRMKDPRYREMLLRAR